MSEFVHVCSVFTLQPACNRYTNWCFFQEVVISYIESIKHKLFINIHSIVYKKYVSLMVKRR